MKCCIVIPTLNEGNTIGNLVSSIAKDPYLNKEIIVVDGGSTDNTVSVAQKNGAVVLKEKGKHKCPANARNQGAKKCNGDIVCFLDGDVDHVGKYFVSNTIKHFKNSNVIGVQCKVKFIDNTLVSKILKSMEESLPIKFFKEKLSAKGMLFTFLRKEVFKQMGGYPVLGFGEDGVLWINLNNYLRVSPDKKIVTKASSVYFQHRCRSFREFFKQSVWYGRTKIAYLKEVRLNVVSETLLLSLPTVYLFSIASIPLMVVSPWFLIPAFPYLAKLFLVLCECIKNHDKYRLLTPLIDLVNGIGHTIGLLQYIFGKKNLSRG